MIAAWENQLPGEDLEALKKVIIQLVFDLFHLESHMVSDAYGGEKFGEGVYYRLVYGTDQTEQRMEVILAFEEKLLINTVGKVMGFESNKLDNMLLHAARYTARQFIGRVLECLPNMKDYELKDDIIPFLSRLLLSVAFYHSSRNPNKDRKNIVIA